MQLFLKMNNIERVNDISKEGVDALNNYVSDKACYHILN